MMTHKDCQHDVLEVVFQVGGVGAEEDEVALDQLQKRERTHSEMQTDQNAGLFYQRWRPTPPGMETGETTAAAQSKRARSSSITTLQIPQLSFCIDLRSASITHLNRNSDEEEGSSQGEVRPVPHHQDESLPERDLFLRLWGVWIWNVEKKKAWGVSDVGRWKG